MRASSRLKYTALGLLLSLIASGCEGNEEEPQAAVSEALTIGSYLYFRCNSTGWQLNDATRLVATNISNIVALSYDVTQTYMTEIGYGSGGDGDPCVVTETNAVNGWGTMSKDYVHSSRIHAPQEATLTAKTSTMQSFRVLYPSLGRHRVTLNRTTGKFRIDAEIPSLELKHSGVDATVQVAFQDVRPGAGLTTQYLPALVNSITVKADGAELAVARKPGIARTPIEYLVPEGVALLRTEYQLLDGSLAFDGRWMLTHHSIDQGRRVVAQLPTGSQVEEINGPIDLDPSPTRAVWDPDEGDAPHVVYTTPSVPDGYQTQESEHYRVRIPTAQAAYRANLTAILERTYALYSRYSGLDVNQIQGQSKYPFTLEPWPYMHAPGLSNKGVSAVFAGVASEIGLSVDPPNYLISLITHELGNGWWGLWERDETTHRTPDWINNEAHSSFLRVEANRDLGYCAEAQNAYGGSRQKFVELCVAGDDPECVKMATVPLLAMRAKYGWGPFRAFYAAVQNDALGLAGKTQVERASIVGKFFADQVHRDLVPFFEQWWGFELTPDIRAAIAQYPSDNVPFPEQLSCPQRLADGGFERALETSWWTEVFSGVASFSRETGLRQTGYSSAKIAAATDDDARLIQTIAVQPNTLYRIGGWIRTESVQGGAGAQLVVEGQDLLSGSSGLYGTTDWTYVTFDVDSGSHTTMMVQARLGNYGSMSRGQAWFDELTAVELTP